MASGTGKRPPSQTAAEAEAAAEVVEAIAEDVMEDVAELEKENPREVPIREVLHGMSELAASLHVIAQQMAAGAAQGPTPRYSDQLLDLIAARTSTPPAPSMTEAQARTMLGYRLLRNGLGNFGGHGDGFDSAWVVMIYADSELAIYRPPAASVSVRPYFSSATGVLKGDPIALQRDANGNLSNPSCIDFSLGTDYALAPAIRFVEVLDSSGFPIAAGQPTTRT